MMRHVERDAEQICNDREEADLWYSGLKALISRAHARRCRTESRSDEIPSEANSPRTIAQRSSPSSSPFGSNDSLRKDGVEHFHHNSPYESPSKHFSNGAFTDIVYTVPAKGFFPSDSASVSVHSVSSSGSGSLHAQTWSLGVDAFRASLSSAVSSSSQGSHHVNGDALGDVFLWGEGAGEGVLGGGGHRIGSYFDFKMDSLFPKALESAVVLDVHDIACGASHAALVTKQGEVFSWGAESSGRLGHGVDSDVFQPKLVEALSNANVEFVACGEHHTCAVTLSGDLYMWGDGTCNFGLLGDGNDTSHWIPKSLSWPVEGIHVSSISCGPWHTVIVTSAGQLFTFGNGTFGVLGHGDCNSCSKPREVEFLKGLRTVHAACGVWHTAAVVEVMVGNSSSSNYSSGKLFTWGDGDKNRLGHGDRDSKLVPTFVAALVEPTFYQVACGHSLTVALSTSGFVYTMGSIENGQLGNPDADGKLPTCVKGKLSKCTVDEIACGGYHVAALTTRNEVYTWGKGANGQLGHGDSIDRNSPTAVEALKDKQVRRIACGTNFTAVVCLHRSVSGVDQSMCSGCRLLFCFKRKRHSCYNCGLLFCHSCSSKKSLKASMAPNPNKTYRVCDNCFVKLRMAAGSEGSHSFVSRVGGSDGALNQPTEKDEELYRTSHLQCARFPSMDSLKQGENHTFVKNKKAEFNSTRVPPIKNGSSHWGGLNISKSFHPVSRSSKKNSSASVPGSRIVSRATSPVSREPRQPRSTTPTPTLGGLILPNASLDFAKTTNSTPCQEVVQLRAQVKYLSYKVKLQVAELERLTKQLKEKRAIAWEEAVKCKAAKEVLKALNAQYDRCFV